MSRKINYNKHKNSVNNTFYDDLGDKWYTANDHPIALLRAENRIRTPWVISHIGQEKKNILDIGCGAGFLANALAKHGHRVSGIDTSPKSLEIAKKRDETATVDYIEANASYLPFSDESFDVVTAMDFLEHVDNPSRIISEIARVLKPNGLFFFHTFNRTFMSWLVVLKGVEWFMKNTPKNIHVYKMFLKPQELKKMCLSKGLSIVDWKGLAPDIWNRDFWKLLTTRTLTEKFSFKITNSLRCGYMGWAQKLNGSNNSKATP